MINRKLVFQEELGWIQDTKLRELAEEMVETLLPEYFFHVAASSTGKYHPDYALGDGGLVRHTKAAMRIANDLCGLEQYQKMFSRNIMDCILISLLFHDGWKHGNEVVAGKFTVAEHPMISAQILEEYLKDKVSDFEISTICSAIRSHMGQWNTDYKTKDEIMPKPETATQEFVHLCDYLASRKYLMFDFGDSYFNPEEFDESKVKKEEIEKLIALCKEKIASGASREVLYAIIEKENGKRNPNLITDRAIYNTIYSAIDKV